MDTEVLELSIVTHKESKNIRALWVEIESPSGSFVVGPDHAPLVSRLKERGHMKYKEYQGQEVTINTYGGIFRVDGNKAIAILDYTDTHPSQ